MEKNSVSQKIRERRIELKLTQRQVADYVGVTEATVSRWESGEIDNMRRDKIAKLAGILNVSPLLIMGIESKAEESDKDSPLTNEELKLVKAYRTLDSDKRRTLSDILAFFSSSQPLLGNISVQKNEGGKNFMNVGTVITT